MKKKSAHPAGPSQRQLRVGELIRQALSEMLARGDIYDDTLASHPVSVTSVRVTPDLKLADIRILPLGGEDTIAVLAALDHNRKFIRGEIAHRINLKFAPDIRFHADDSFDARTQIERILDSEQVRRDTRKPAASND
ncbi:30S ribosome-binding factor RbfA [Terrarubrum flagellatum]|uniref:30S ribosome-binding factor RbfA n=1 Tax=Terrirubrum flagellatum TaxID=2895980 RepID=UPI003144D5E5